MSHIFFFSSLASSFGCSFSFFTGGGLRTNIKGVVEGERLMCYLILQAKHTQKRPPEYYKNIKTRQLHNKDL